MPNTFSTIIPRAPQKTRQLVARATTVPVELLPEEMRPPKPRFVSINPEAPSFSPPKTQNTGAATQRAAQPRPDTQRNDMPKIDGEIEKSTHIVNNIPREFLPQHLQPKPGQPLGHLPTNDTPETPAPPTAPPSADTQSPTHTAPDQPSPQQQDTSAGRADRTKESFPKHKAENSREKRSTTDDTTRQRADKQPNTEKKKTKPAPNPENKNKATTKPTITRQENAADNLTPAPRPQAAKVGTFGLLARRPTGTNEAGIVSLDSRYSEFGDYAQRMVEIIQANWWMSLMRTKHRETGHTVVVIEFILRKDGTLRNVVIKESSASQTGTYTCKDAIESRTPFDPWTPEMIATLGDEDHGCFTFHYR
ncbi:MAG: TonB C-terminal domain-containing protein [Puniceicoccales bacterium]|nr:TonB C-terminal domain-containing protein [Puniceicoccales bacterium]